MKSLIIEIPYGGLGDHLFHSHLPRIAKEHNGYDEVLVSTRSLFRHTDNKKLVWELNPFVDGFTDKPGQSINFNQINKLTSIKHNLLDVIMHSFNLDNGQLGNCPEIFYVPKYQEKWNKIVFDPNYLSWIGNTTPSKAIRFFKKNNFHFEAIMKKRSDKFLFETDHNLMIFETENLFDFCDLIFSSKQLYCLSSGTATLATALKKNATVFWGEGQDTAYHHSDIHNYVLIKSSLMDKLLSKLH